MGSAQNSAYIYRNSAYTGDEMTSDRSMASIGTIAIMPVLFETAVHLAKAMITIHTKRPIAQNT
jgi:hypothetical protein